MALTAQWRHTMANYVYCRIDSTDRLSAAEIDPAAATDAGYLGVEAWLIALALDGLAVREGECES